MIEIRAEHLHDVPARERLLDACFPGNRRAKTSERLREGRLPALSLVAQDPAGRVIGTVRLWHVSAGPGRRALLLGPLAVDAAHRGEGLGGRLMRAALGRAALMGEKAVLLVGDAPYYGRFGFDASLTERLWLPGPVARERFLGLELREGALQGAAGLVSATGEQTPVPSLAELVTGLGADERTALAQAA